MGQDDRRRNLSRGTGLYGPPLSRPDHSRTGGGEGLSGEHFQLHQRRGDGDRQTAQDQIPQSRGDPSSGDPGRHVAPLRGHLSQGRGLGCADHREGPLRAPGTGSALSGTADHPVLSGSARAGRTGHDDSDGHHGGLSEERLESGERTQQDHLDAGGGSGTRDWQSAEQSLSESAAAPADVPAGGCGSPGGGGEH